MIECPFCHAKFSKTPSKTRSKNQNDYYFGVLVKFISEETGYTPEETHDILKSMFNYKRKTIETKEGFNEVLVVKSTTGLTTVEFEEYQSKIRQWASMSLGLFLPVPNEELPEEFA